MFILKCKLTNLQKYKSTHHIYDHTIQLIYKIHVIGIYASLRNRVQQRMFFKYLQTVSQVWPQREGRATQPRPPPSFNESRVVQCPLLQVYTSPNSCVQLISFFILVMSQFEVVRPDKNDSAGFLLSWVYVDQIVVIPPVDQ